MHRWLCSMSAASLLALAGCNAATKPDADGDAGRIAHDRVLCAKYGYDAGTDDFENCMRTLAERRDASAQKQKALAAHDAQNGAAKSSCEGRNDIIVGGSRAMPNEVGTEKCSH